MKYIYTRHINRALNELDLNDIKAKFRINNHLFHIAGYFSTLTLYVSLLSGASQEKAQRIEKNTFPKKALKRALIARRMNLRLSMNDINEIIVGLE